MSLALKRFRFQWWRWDKYASSDNTGWKVAGVPRGVQRRGSGLQRKRRLLLARSTILPFCGFKGKMNLMWKGWLRHLTLYKLLWSKVRKRFRRKGNCLEGMSKILSRRINENKKKNKKKPQKISISHPCSISPRLWDLEIRGLVLFFSVSPGCSTVCEPQWELDKHL